MIYREAALTLGSGNPGHVAGVRVRARMSVVRCPVVADRDDRPE